MNHHAPELLLPESLAYQNALERWQDFQEIAKTTRLDQMLCSPEAFGTATYAEALNLLPPNERRPVVFGELARNANGFSPQNYASMREQLLPDASAFELDALDAVRKGEISMPGKLPVTLEEFPSRIWQRAVASGSPQRLAAAGCKAIDTTLRLLSEMDYLPETDDNGGDEVVCRIEIGDAPDIFDPIALAPREHLGLKIILIEALMAKVEAEESTLFKELFEIIPAWVLLDDADRDSRIHQLIQQTRNLMDEANHSEKKNLATRHRLRKLGRLLFRLGHRKESLRSARALGLSAWSKGWQFQPIDGKTHARIRKHLLRPATNVDAWQHEPALACSAMSLPLWLCDGVSRVSELTTLFNGADVFPWVFPRLHHVFQWHLAIAGNHAALREIAGMDSGGDLGLCG